jgi:hypothetical protein
MNACVDGGDQGLLFNKGPVLDGLVGVFINGPPVPSIRDLHGQVWAGAGVALAAARV